VVSARGVRIADVAVEAGRIVEVAPRLGAAGAEVLEAAGLHVFPGGIDSHVHFNEPGRTEWETIGDGSAALAAGGCTSFIDMPLNCRPVTTGADAFELKRRAAERSSLVDFGFWGGLIPGNLDRLEELVERGALGFKAFMCPSGIDEFPACDESVLREAMTRIAALDSILLLHAEDPVALKPQHGRSARDFLASRPAEAELSAIRKAIDLATDTRCRLHVVHVSTAAGADLIERARQVGVDVSGETCPHYLLYTADDLERMGGVAKCSPPFRSVADRDGLWRMLEGGEMPIVVSDHSPSTLELKQGGDFFQLWGGISSCQSTRQLLLAQDRLALEALAAVTATNVARRFGLPGKGDIAPGFDADLWIVDLSHEHLLRREELFYRNAFSAHEGQRVRGRTVRTLVRGRTVFQDGEVVSKPMGRLMRSSPAAR
jgi:allantoinase